MKRKYSKLAMHPILAVPEDGILASSIKMNGKVTVEDYKDGFGGTLDNPGIVDLKFD